MRVISDFIIKPLISEKSFKEADRRRYTFIVRRDATKTDIKNAIQKLFGVKVLKVFTAHIRRSKIQTTRKGKRIIDASYKKARVLLPEGTKLDIFEEKTDAKKHEKETSKTKGSD